MPARRDRTPPVLSFVLWCAVALLTGIGVAAVIARGLYPADFGARLDPLRTQLMDLLDREDPYALHRAEEVEQFDRRFAAHPVMTRLHILPGGLFLLLAPLQFSSRIRSRHIRFHRWSGRVLMLAAFVTALSGLYFGLLMPFGGPAEAAAIALFGGLLLIAVIRGLLAIRSGQVALHREWMIRAFALGIAISTVRVVAPVVDYALTPAGFRSWEMFALSVWLGWLLTLGAAEAWIRYTRPSSLSRGALRRAPLNPPLACAPMALGRAPK